ncbi:YkuS family protein [Clostridiaceae bacterium 35-E11]
MEKVIAVQTGLDHITKRLKGKGYLVTDMNETDRPIDAIIYSESAGYQNPPSIKAVEIPSNNQFVVMLNADELDEEEILNRIDSMR